MANSILAGTPNTNNNFMSQFQQFKQAYRGNPKQEVMRMLETGQINDQQLQQLVHQAQQLRNRVLTF